MRLRPPSGATLIAFAAIVAVAVVVQVVHAYLLLLTHDAADLAWMTVFSSSAALAAVALLGGASLRNGPKDGNGT